MSAQLSRVVADEVTTNPTQADYCSVLLRAIASTDRDPTQLRGLVYELARIKLRQEAFLENTSLSVSEIFEHLEALEGAIWHVEKMCAKQDAARALQSPQAPQAQVAPAPPGQDGAPSARERGPGREEPLAAARGRVSHDPAPIVQDNAPIVQDLDPVPSRAASMQNPDPIPAKPVEREPPMLRLAEERTSMRQILSLGATAAAVLVAAGLGFWAYQTAIARDGTDAWSRTASPAKVASPTPVKPQERVAGPSRSDSPATLPRPVARVVYTLGQPGR
jgi:hypothetical protein